MKVHISNKNCASKKWRSLIEKKIKELLNFTRILRHWKMEESENDSHWKTSEETAGNFVKKSNFIKFHVMCCVIAMEKTPGEKSSILFLWGFKTYKTSTRIMKDKTRKWIRQLGSTKVDHEGAARFKCPKCPDQRFRRKLRAIHFLNFNLWNFASRNFLKSPSSNPTDLVSRQFQCSHWHHREMWSLFKFRSSRFVSAIGNYLNVSRSSY